MHITLFKDTTRSSLSCVVLTLLLLTGLLTACQHSKTLDASSWETLDTRGKMTPRHEASFVNYKGKLYLIGGRGIKAVESYDPDTNQWQTLAKPPIEIHHFQAVAMDDGIYMLGALTGKYPGETPIDKVLVFIPEQNSFEFRHTIPKARQRGAAGAVRHGDYIYLVAGIVNGHIGGYQPWLDRYHTKTGAWEVLQDAPNARDHFAAAIINDVLYAVGGRTSSQGTGQTFELTVRQGDAYDLNTQQWLPTDSALAIPTPRAGSMTIGLGPYLVVGGGESGEQPIAHNEIEAFHIDNRTWQAWPNMQRGRHGSGLAKHGDFLYTCSGSGNRGGRPELESTERLDLSSLGRL